MTEKERLLTKLLGVIRLARDNENSNEAEAARRTAAKIRQRLTSEFQMSDQEVLDWLENQDFPQAEEAPPPSEPKTKTKAKPKEPTIPNAVESFFSQIFGQSSVDSFREFFQGNTQGKSPSNHVYEAATADDNGPRRIRKGLWIWSVQLNEFWQRSLLEYACKRAGCTFFAKTLLDIKIIGCSNQDVSSAFGLYQIMEERCGAIGNRRYGRMLKYVDGSGLLQSVLRNGQKILKNIYFAGMASGVEVLRQTHNIDDQFEAMRRRVEEATRRWEEWNQEE